MMTRGASVAATLAITLGLAACVSSGWVKPGSGQAEWDHDSYECERDVRQSRTRGLDDRASYFEHCLRAHGWADNGGEAGFKAPIPR